MGILSRLFGRTEEKPPAVPDRAETAPAEEAVQPEPESEPVPEPVDPAQLWAEELEARDDYRTLAAVNNSQDYSQEFMKNRKRAAANRILMEAGSKAVDGILEELATDGVGSSDLAEVLVAIGDPKAVPLLKTFFDRGEFKAYGSAQGKVKEFIEAHPDSAGETETLECAVCHRVRPVTEMRYFIDDGTKKFFCLDGCWDRRGSVLVSAGTATGCPFFSSGMCSAGEGGQVCSFRGASYQTGCFVYSMQR
jgi:hypothetical protein